MPMITPTAEKMKWRGLRMVFSTTICERLRIGIIIEPPRRLARRLARALRRGRYPNARFARCPTPWAWRGSCRTSGVFVAGLVALDDRAVTHRDHALRDRRHAALVGDDHQG